MPLYQYQCLDCKAAFEVQHMSREQPKYPCPQCGGLTQKGLTQINIHTKQLSQSSETALSEPSTPHQCHPGCALHQPLDTWLSPNPPETVPKERLD